MIAAVEFLFNEIFWATQSVVWVQEEIDASFSKLCQELVKHHGTLKN
jgi:hypothetical protein